MGVLEGRGLGKGNWREGVSWKGSGGRRGYREGAGDRGSGE